jgi:hypothetical protein
MSAQPQTVTLDLNVTGVEAATVHTLAASEPSLQSVSSLVSVTLPPSLRGWLRCSDSRGDQRAAGAAASPSLWGAKTQTGQSNY